MAFCVAAALFLAYRQTHITISGTSYRRDITVLDLSGVQSPELDRIAELKGLQALNMENTGIGLSDYLALRAALPQCRITWLVPFKGSFYPQDTAEIAFSRLTAEDVDALLCLPQLRKVDARGCTDYGPLMALKEKLPDCDIQYEVTLDGTTYPGDAQSIVYRQPDGKALAEAMAYLPHVTQVDASGCTDYAQIAQLQKDHPDCDFLYTVTLGGESYPQNATAITLPAGSLDALSTLLPYLPEVTELTLTGVTDDPQAVYALSRQYPQIDFTWSFSLLGAEVCNKDSFIDLSEIPMENTTELEAALPYFANLEKVDMVHCGISNEDMAALNRRHPDTAFVWTVMVSVIELRTDITYFMPYKYGYKINNEHAKNLQYCTEIMCLDLGHQDIVDTDFLNTMTKMEYLLLADTDISDLSFCRNMPDLKYLEIFLTKVRDVSPLEACTKLEDLNLSYTYPKNVDALCQLPGLKNLWMRGYEFQQQQAQIKAALPDTCVRFDHGPCTDGGWRKLPNYFAMRDILGMPYME